VRGDTTPIREGRLSSAGRVLAGGSGGGSRLGELRRRCSCLGLVRVLSLPLVRGGVRGRGRVAIPSHALPHVVAVGRGVVVALLVWGGPHVCRQGRGGA